jgi:hypothetical protein
MSMISSKIPFFLLVVALITGCSGGGGSVSGGGGGGGGGSSSGSGPGSGGGITANNVLSITVNGSLCSASTSASYVNKACVSVTVCDTSTCQMIDDILLDTGSYGLRIFKSALNPAISLTQIVMGSGSLAECAQFGDGSSEWGPVQLAGITLASEPTVTVPIQVIDSTFANIATSSTSTICPGAVQSPADAGFNGILGVGVFRQDCGPACSSSAGIGIYYSCTGSTCSGTTVALSSQVQNPVALLPVDNNGVIVKLPSVPLSGTSSVNGFLVLGIGTQTNNGPSGVTRYSTDGFGEIITTVSGTTVTYSSIIDSGSNGLFFTPPSAGLLPDCASPNESWFCPSSTVAFSATNAGALGSTSGMVSFQIGNFDSLTTSSNNVFSNIGGSAPGIFDWGLPFYFGRDVYVGIEGKGSSIGSGPYWAY